MVDHMTNLRRSSWAVVLVFLHLFVTPCASAMVLLPADADCEHCQTINSPDACVVATAAANSVIAGVAVDSGRADPPRPAGQLSLLLPAERLGPLPGAVTSDFRPRSFAARHTGDPPLYLLLGQLRI
jgi:hypothetical protein